jgi:hypothetical protein
MEQNVPLGPLDSRHAVRRHGRRRLRAPFSLRMPVLLVVAGLALAAAGVWLSVSPPQVEVSESASAYTIGRVRLGAEGAGTYAGPAGALVLRADGDTERAGASTTLNGRHMIGLCAWGRGAGWESCLFTLGDRTLTATDTRTPSGWHRRYDGGAQVDLIVRGGGAVLVPFAVGLG